MANNRAGGRSGRGGRGRGRGRSRGRAAGRSSSSSTSSNTNRPEVKKLNEQMYQVGKNAALFEQVNKFLINHIQKTFRDGGDLATALRDETEYDFEADFAKPILMSVPGKVDDPNVIAARDQARIVFENQSRIF